MKQFIVCKIHNNSLGSIQAFDNERDAIDTLRRMAEEQFARPLTNEEFFDSAHSLEIINDEDPDNIYCFSIGILD